MDNVLYVVQPPAHQWETRKLNAWIYPQGYLWCKLGQHAPHISYFSPAPNKLYGRGNWCNICKRRHNDSYKNRLRHVKKTYGLSPAAYTNLVTVANKQCMICGAEKELCIDHNHETGKVRGLLCNICNMYIGNIRENTTTLQKAIDYLEKE